MQKPLAEELPSCSGVYLYKDKNAKIIYVGKAINLRKRVFSYFRPEHTLTPKTNLMLSHAVSIDIITTTTEKEALLLEASLIKKHRPRFNIVLRDDKQYVLYKFSVRDPYPRLEITRSVKKDGAKYYGPFTSGFSAKETWKNIHRLFPLRRCSDKAFNNRVRPCLYHFIGQCLAPCTNDVDKAEYAKIVQRVSLLLSGKSKELKEDLEHIMLKAAEELDFEKAAIYRDQLQALEKTLEKQSTVLPEGGDRDILGLIQSKQGLSLGLVFVRNGMMIDSRSFHWQGLDFEEAHELLLTFLTQYYATAFIPEHIVLPFLPQSIESSTEEEHSQKQSLEDEIKNLEQNLSEIRATNLNITTKTHVRVRLARTPEENRLIEIAQNNARESAKRKEEKPISEILASYFNTEKAIKRIECIDVSHTFGQATKLGMVVFEDGKEVKEEYRAWNIDAKGDDYLALAKWAKIRLDRAERKTFPDLLLIDGGKGQLTSVYHAFLEAFKSMEQKQEEKIQALSSENPLPFFIASIAKARDEEGKQDRRAGNIADRIFIPNRTNPLNMKAGSQELLFLQKVRDTAHNFSIHKHRQARTKLALESELLRLPGVGMKTLEILWKNFSTVDDMLSAKADDLAKIQGISRKKAYELYDKLQSIAKE